MPPPSAPLVVGLGALRTSVGDSVHLVSTCQDTVFFGSGSDSGSGCGSGSVNAFKLWLCQCFQALALLRPKKQHLCLLEVILPCSACMPSPAWAVRCLSNFFAVPCLSRPVLRMREPAVWRVDALLTLLPALLGSPFMGGDPVAVGCYLS